MKCSYRLLIKDALYLMLTRIGRGEYNTDKMLAQYQKELSAFETNFVFTHVTEVPQYQTLYERVQQAFSIKSIFEDVREPLEKLTEVRNRDEEKRRKTINAVLAVISFLAVFSALTDAFDFCGKIGDQLKLGEQLTWTMQRAFSVVIIIVFLVAVIYIIITKVKAKRLEKHAGRTHKKQ